MPQLTPGTEVQEAQSWRESSSSQKSEEQGGSTTSECRSRKGSDPAGQHSRTGGRARSPFSPHHRPTWQLPPGFHILPLNSQASPLQPVLLTHPRKVLVKVQRVSTGGSTVLCNGKCRTALAAGFRETVARGAPKVTSGMCASVEGTRGTEPMGKTRKGA
jgi:hypothetical protein